MRDVSIYFLAAAVIDIHAGFVAKVVIDCPRRTGCCLVEVVAGSDRALRSLRANRYRTYNRSLGNCDDSSAAIFSDCDGIGYRADVDGCHAV